jgi:hypothetical protein
MGSDRTPRVLAVRLSFEATILSNEEKRGEEIRLEVCTISCCTGIWPFDSSRGVRAVWHYAAAGEVGGMARSEWASAFEFDLRKTG